MISKKHIVLFFILFSLTGYSQFHVWRLTAYSASAGIRANYRENKTKATLYTSKQTSAFLNGNLNIRTKSYFVHPNFMEVILNANYNPSTSGAFTLAEPDFSEKTNTEGIDFSSIFLKKKKINITANASMNRSMSNIENITKVKAKGKSFGAGLYYENKILPFSVNYSQDKTEQEIVGTNRIFFSDFRFYQANATKSFTTHDENSLLYIHSKSKSLQIEDILGPIRSTSNNNFISYSNTIFFDKGKKYTLGSSVSYSYILGNINYNTWSGSESMHLILPKRFSLDNGYNWGISQQGTNKIYNQSFQSTLNHQLFESLSSRFSFFHNQTSQTGYNQESNKFGVNLIYTKKIPTGNLLFSYNYNKDYNSVKTPPTLLYTFHEGYKLIDGQITLLKNENISMSSIVVRDSTGGVIYILNVDYILIDKKPYVEIIRVPGGLISNGASVYIDYNALHSGLYKYTGQANGFYLTLNLFKNKLSAYYSIAWQGYNNKNKTENLVLNYNTSQIIGLRLDFNIIKGGAEYQYYKSNILPYQGMRYYLSFQKTYSDLNININANMQDMQMTNEKLRRQNIDASFAIAYRIFQSINMHIDYMYRKMVGQGIDLTVHTSKFVISSYFHQFSASVGVQFNLAKRTNIETNYKGIFIQLTRKF